MSAPLSDWSCMHHDDCNASKEKLPCSLIYAHRPSGPRYPERSTPYMARLLDGYRTPPYLTEGPDAKLLTPYYAKLTSSSSFSSSRSHHVLRSRYSTTQRKGKSNIAVSAHVGSLAHLPEDQHSYPRHGVRQPHQLNANQRHVHFIENKYHEDTRPGQQVETAQRQPADLC
eukprot:1160656-Pelagomonas_calceolata.AAC.8